jgi:hypothetical protein
LSIFSADHAEKIAKKLTKGIDGGRRHDHVYVLWRGMEIANYGIRRSSHEVGHDFIPKQLHIQTRQAMNLAQCPLSREEYFNILRIHGNLPNPQCEMCQTDDFDREVTAYEYAWKKKTYVTKLCSGCKTLADRRDAAALRHLNEILAAKAK